MDLSVTRRALALLALSTAVVAPAWADGVVTGFVFARSGAPVAGALVAIEELDIQARTDGFGAYAVAVPAGTWTVRVEVPGAPVATFPGVVVVDEVSTEVLVTIDPQVVQIEAPSPEDAPAEQQAVDGVTGDVLGTIVDADNPKQTVAGARVFVRGLAVEAVTDRDGRFALSLPPGVWELSVLKSGYATRSLPGVQVVGETTTPVTVNLVPAGMRLAEFVITAPRIEGGTADLLEERRDSASVGDVLGAEQMSRSGDSDAASALKRVTGLTVVGGKFVYVRGLGERYSASLLNGAQIPSPEPERRVVPLDMIPASVLESVVIQKTFSPDMPAEFGGGVVRLRTRTAPEQPFFSVNLKGGINTFTTFRDGLRYDGGATDWLGIDDGSRDLPDPIQQASDDQKLEPGDMFSDSGYTAEELENFGEMLSNNYEIYRRTLGPDVGGSVSGGGSFTVGDTTVGLLGALSYSHGWDYANFDRTYYLVGDGDKLEAAHTYNFESTTRQVGLGGLVVADVQVGDNHRIALTSFLNRSTDDETRIYQGNNRDVATDIRVSRLRWVERQLLTEQLTGSHTLPMLADFTIDWRYTYSNATRKEPDRREYRFDYEPNDAGEDIWFLSDRPEGNQRFFSYLNDDIHDVGLDLTQPFVWWRGLEGSVKVGGLMVDRVRSVDTRRFKYMHKGGASNDFDVLSSDIEDIFVPDNIAAGNFQLEETTLATDNYQASQRVWAGYAMLDAYVLPGTRLMGGVRVESSAQDVTTFELFNPDATPIIAQLETVDVLPAVTVTQELSETMQVRAGYGRTLSRPDFRELSPATFNDVTGGRQRFGNADLQRALIDNVDLRWEWYPSPGESLSVGAFYKRFTDPIETVVRASAQLSVTYDNVLGADNVGIEVDTRKNLDFLPGAWQDVYVAANVSLIYSQVRLDEDGAGVQTSSRRSLQGQSPYVINAQVGYADPEGVFSTAVLYNVFGPRIVEVGALGSPDTFELPVHQLDATASWRAPFGMKLSVKAKNLLDWPVRFRQGDYQTEASFRGREFSIGVGFRI